MLVLCLVEVRLSVKQNNMMTRQTKYICFDSHPCKACWKCIENCPNGVIGQVVFLWHKHATIDFTDGCTGCAKCVKVCPVGAFTFISKRK